MSACVFVWHMQDDMCLFSCQKGAAVATIFGQIAAAIMSLIYLFRMKMVRISRDSFRLRLQLMKRIIPLGITSFLSQISIVLSMAAVLNMVTKYGAMDPVFGQPEYSQIPTAVVGIVMKFFQIVISVSVGLAAGCIPIVGYNIGAGRSDRVLGLMKRLEISEAAVGLAASVVFMMSPHTLINIFGVVNAKQSTVLSMMREIIFGVGLPIILPVFRGLYGILYFMPVADALTFLASAAVIIHTGKILSRASVRDTDEASAPPEKQLSGAATIS